MFSARAMNASAGGVQKMIVALMNEMTRRGHSADLVTWDTASGATFFPMAPEVTWRRLDMGDPKKTAGPALIARRMGVVRHLVKRLRPDAIVCFQDGPFRAMALYTAGMGVPLVAAERNAPTRFDHTKAGRWRDAILHSFLLAKRVTIQFESYRDLYPAAVRSRMTVIPNPVGAVQGSAEPARASEDGRFLLLSVGRLGYQKNYEVLIRAFATLAERFPLWDLAIVGDGEDREALARVVRDAPGLEARVTLPGTSRDVPAWYRRAHLFCLPSRWEGFPNALAEAMAHGLPSIGFADCAGVRDLIASRGAGLLVKGMGDAETLAEALATLMADGPMRERMGRAAVETAGGYAPSRVFDEWERVLGEVAAR